MAKQTGIEWTEATWNPWHGCHKVSAGCKNCYMFREKKRFGHDPNVVVRSKTKFYDPLKWKEPRTIFTCSWSDFFIEEADPWRDEAFAIMILTPHTYQVLTKRPDRMLEWFNEKWQPAPEQRFGRFHMPAETVGEDRRCQVSREVSELVDDYKLVNLDSEDAWTAEGSMKALHFAWPPPNVWLGVSVEDQKTADERIPLLLQTPATLRWLSIEPLLGQVDLFKFFDVHHGDEGTNSFDPKIDWVVVGGESGPDARPMHPNWVRSIRDQCKAAGVPFFFKQWGEWLHDSQAKEWLWPEFVATNRKHDLALFTGMGGMVYKVGKKKAGRLLDGREWNEMPEVQNAL